MGLSEDIDGSYTIIANGNETARDEELYKEFHWVAVYDRTATEGKWVENPRHSDAQPVFKKGSITEPYRDNVDQIIPRSHKEGEQPVFEDEVYIKIAVPGDRFSIVDKKATAIYQKRFPKEWDAFCKGEDQDSASGRSLELLVKVGLLKPSQCELLRYHYIRTIEQLCAVGDDKSPLLGFKRIQQKAREFVALTKKDEAAKAQEDTSNRVAALEAQLAAMKGKPAKRRGRPPKKLNPQSIPSA